MKNSPILVVVMCLSLATQALAAQASAVRANADKPIKVVVSNWTSQIVLAHVTGSIFKHLGYAVRYVPISTSDQWGALSHGVAHVQVAVDDPLVVGSPGDLPGVGQMEFQVFFFPVGILRFFHG